MDKALIRRGLHVAAAILVAVLAIGLYKAKTDASQTEARVNELRIEIADAEADMRALRAEIARAESPANVAALAQSHLGLDAAAQSEGLPEAAIDNRLPDARARAIEKASEAQ
jgi:cell division protein FtsL